MLAALSTEHKIGLLTVGLIFIAFALVSALLVPRYRPRYPGRRLGLFIAASVVLFVAMLTAVEVFAVEEEEEAGAEAAAETTHGETATTTTSATTTAGGGAQGGVQTLAVTETEFKIALPNTTLGPGKYEFDVSNKGSVGHDLVVEGEGIDEKTDVIDAGGQAKLEVELKPGTYDFYCSVPGHKEAGMEVKVTVTSSTTTIG